MAKKRIKIVKKKVVKGKSRIKKEENVIEDIKENLEETAEEVEQWVIERKKFFKKLGWVVGFIVLLLIISHFYLRVKGVGI